jgi:hypothetical protein
MLVVAMMFFQIAESGEWFLDLVQTHTDVGGCSDEKTCQKLHAFIIHLVVYDAAIQPPQDASLRTGAGGCCSGSTQDKADLSQNISRSKPDDRQILPLLVQVDIASNYNLHITGRFLGTEEMFTGSQFQYVSKFLKPCQVIRSEYNSKL